MAPYQGFKNWTHWNVSLWLNNDEGLYLTSQKHARSGLSLTRAAARLQRELPDRTPDGARISLSALVAHLKNEREGIEIQNRLDAERVGQTPPAAGHHLVACDGAAHSNPHIDNCHTCAPRWGWVEIPNRHRTLNDWLNERAAAVSAAEDRRLKAGQ